MLEWAENTKIKGSYLAHHWMTCDSSIQRGNREVGSGGSRRPKQVDKCADTQDYMDGNSSHFEPMGLNVAILSVVTKDLAISPRFTPYDFSSRCKFSTLTALLQYSTVQLVNQS